MLYVVFSPSLSLSLMCDSVSVMCWGAAVGSKLSVGFVGCVCVLLIDWCSCLQIAVSIAAGGVHPTATVDLPSPASTAHRSAPKEENEATRGPAAGALSHGGEWEPS